MAKGDKQKRAAVRTYFKAWRKHRGLSQERFAELVGMTGASISRIEGGDQNWDQEFLLKAAEVLECTPGDLLTRRPDDPDINQLWEKLGDAGREEAAEVLAVLARRNSAA